jgi:hypothetical protein
MRTAEHNFAALTGEARQSEDRALMFWLSTPWGKVFWPANRAIYDSEFAEHCDKLIRRAEQLNVTPRDLKNSR